MCKTCATQEPAGQIPSQPEMSVAKRATAPATVAPDAEYFTGIIKSYNERRGFGFLACDETAQRFGRDVYLSKVESLAAIREGEAQLKEGDYVRFSVVPSVEGFPQAAAAQRVYMLQGSVIRFSQEQGCSIICSMGEVFARPGSSGYLLLHPGDEVSFCLERSADGALEAKLLKLLRTVRPDSSLLGCFSLGFPRDGKESVALDAHAFARCICISGLPSDLGQAELSKFFLKLGAVEVTVAHAGNDGFASILFPDAKDVAQFLAVENHSFTEEMNTVLAHLQPCRLAGAQTLPALPPPSLLQVDAGVLVRWEPVSLATAYQVEIRALGAGSWSPVDAVGRVQPAGAAPLLGIQITCLAIEGLSSGLPYEARVSYVASCGCRCSPSDPSGAALSSSPCSPCSPQTSISTLPAAATPATVSTQMQLLPPPPAACAFPPMMQATGAPPAPSAPLILSAPPQPEVLISNVSGAVSVRWSTVGVTATGYVVDLCEGSTFNVSRFACHAPADPTGSLELCIQGLQAGQSYTACVCSLSQEGFESVSSPWSCWVTLPMMLQPCALPIVQMPSPPVQQPQPAPQTSQSPYSILFDEVSQGNPQGLIKKCPPPEITGQEDALFLD